MIWFAIVLLLELFLVAALVWCFVRCVDRQRRQRFSSKRAFFAPSLLAALILFLSMSALAPRLLDLPAAWTGRYVYDKVVVEPSFWPWMLNSDKGRFSFAPSLTAELKQGQQRQIAYLRWSRYIVDVYTPDADGGQHE